MESENRLRSFLEQINPRVKEDRLNKINTMANKYGAFNTDTVQLNDQKQQLTNIPINANLISLNEPIPIKHDELITLVYILVGVALIWLALQIFKEYHHCLKKKYVRKTPV